MLQEGTCSKKRKTPKAGPSTTPATSTPPPPMYTEVLPVAMPPPPLAETTAPPPSPVGPQGEPPIPTYVQETLVNLKELSGRVISHLKKMADKFNSIELRVERLERAVAPQLPHHPSVPFDLRTQSNEDEDKT